MLYKKTIKNILLEVEARCYGYETYLQDIVVDEILNNNNNDTKYLITRENADMWLCMYSYSEKDYVQWLYNNFSVNEIDEIKSLLINYEVRKDFVQQNYINYDIQDNILNYISVKKFRKELLNNKKLLSKVRRMIYSNIRNYDNNKYLVKEYLLNKHLYNELNTIRKEV